MTHRDDGPPRRTVVPLAIVFYVFTVGDMLYAFYLASQGRPGEAIAFNIACSMISLVWAILLTVKAKP